MDHAKLELIVPAVNLMITLQIYVFFAPLNALHAQIKLFVKPALKDSLLEIINV